MVEIRKAGLGATDPGKSFTFDPVYDWNSKQNELYLETFSPLVDSGKGEIQQLPNYCNFWLPFFKTLAKFLVSIQN